MSDLSYDFFELRIENGDLACIIVICILIKAVLSSADEPINEENLLEEDIN